MTLLKAWVKGLTPDMVKRAEVELNETPERRTEALKELKTLIKEEPDFGPLQDDEFLVRFLRCKKYDVNRAFKTLRNYYDFKSRYCGVVTGFTPNDLKHIFEMDKVLVPATRGFTDEGIIVATLGSFDVETCSVEQHLAACLIAAEIGMETEGSQVCGCGVVVDMEGMTWRKLGQYLSPSFVRMLSRVLHDSMPFRVNAIHIVNEPSYFGSAYRIIKHLLSKKIQDRIHLHSYDLDSLHQCIPPEALPEELGGSLGKKDFQYFRKMMLQNNELVERLNTYVFNGVMSTNHNGVSLDKENLDVTTRTLFNITPPELDVTAASVEMSS